MIGIRIWWVGLLLATAFTAEAQLILQPRPVRQATQRTRESGQARTQALVLSLPFFDDFSNVTDTHPSDSLWEFGASCIVSQGNALKSPGLGTLTLDGLDSLGAPYSEQLLLNGFRDKLTSSAIDLASVPLANRNSVWLSFFFEWGGNGERPDPTDFLQLEFLRDDNSWEVITRIYPDEELTSAAFKDTLIQVADEAYFHAGFRMRWKTFGRLSGAFDSWHLDYIYLDQNRSANDNSWPDRALSGQLGPLFGRFRAIPRHHFALEPVLTVQPFEIRNMKSIAAAVNFRTQVTFRNFVDKLPYPEYDVELASATPINITNNTLFGFEHKTIRTDTLPDPDDGLQFRPDADSIQLQFRVILNSNDNVPKNNVLPIEPDSTGDYVPRYEPINFRRNDTLRAEYILASYYAYDDGGAEYSATLTNAGNRAAVAFALPDGLIDTLVGFDIHFETRTENLTADFYIYPDLEGVPGDPIYSLFNRAATFSGNNAFTRFTIEPVLVQKRFYIGWKAPVTSGLLVGLDNSHDTGDQIYVNTGAGWFQNTDVVGSLMIRPRFGSGDIVTALEPEGKRMTPFPNPSNGQFNLPGKVDVLSIRDITGRPVPYTANRRDNETEIKMNVPDGVYLLHYRSGTYGTAKIIILN